MEGELSLQINLNLQKLSMITVATSLWQASDIKQEIRKSYSIANKQLPLYEDCYTIAQKVIHNKNSLSIPATASKNLDEVIIYVGENLFDWIYYVRDVMCLPVSYIEKIYWTDIGMIDEEKIYRSSWLRMGFLNLMGNLYFKANANSIYVLASIHADERFLRDSIPEMTYEIRRKYPEVNINNYNDKIYTFISLWLYMNFGDHTEGFNSVVFSRTGYIIPVEFMFHLCVVRNLIIAAKYFFSKLGTNDQHQFASDKAKIVCLQECRSRIYLGRYKDQIPTCSYFTYKKSPEMLIFLIKNMEDEQRLIFLNEFHPLVIKALSHYWFFPELAWSSFFNFDWPYEEDENRMDDMAYESLLDSILLHKEQDIQAHCPIQKTVFNFLLYEVWEKIPSVLKPKVISFSTINRNGFLSKIFTIFDLDFIKFLLNDPDIGTSAHSLIDKAVHKCQTLIDRKEYLLVLQFITDVLPKNEWENFLKRIHLLEKLIKKDEFDIAEQILDILANRHGSKSKSQFKSEINGASVCHKLVDNREFDLANKYLNWQFDTEEERRNFKAVLKSDVHVITGIIHRIWNESHRTTPHLEGLNKRVMAKRCLDCLMFYCESEEEANAYRVENKFDLLENDNYRNLILGL